MAGLCLRAVPVRAVWLVLAALVIAGCSSREESGTATLHETNADSAPRTLAYVHEVSVDVPEPDVRTLHDRTLASCNAQAKGTCVVLSSKVVGGEEAEASLSMRATPAVVRSLIASLGQQGEVTSVETQATDLAKPIADTERTAAMLASYRAKLEQLAERAGNDADALIRVHRELAEVQSRIEATAGEREQLRKQVELEILNVSITSERHVAFSKPIARAFRDFGVDLSRGIAGAVTGVAVLMPGALVLAFCIWVVRRWRRRKAVAKG